jgi:hypothetical protein
MSEHTIWQEYMFLNPPSINHALNKVYKRLKPIISIFNSSNQAYTVTRTRGAARFVSEDTSCSLLNWAWFVLINFPTCMFLRFPFLISLVLHALGETQTQVYFPPVRCVLLRTTLTTELALLSHSCS